MANIIITPLSVYDLLDDTLSDIEIKRIYESPNNQSWFFISLYKKLSEDFMREFQDKIIWTEISYSQKLSKEFIAEFAHKIQFRTLLLSNPNISNDIKDYCRMFI